MVLILASSMVVQQSNAISLPSLDTIPKKVGFGLVATGATLFLAYQGYRFFREMYYIDSLHCACRDDDEEAVRRLRPKLTPHIVNFILDSATPLGLACRNNNLEIAKELIPHTSQNMINYPSFVCTNPDGGGDGGRPLHFACTNKKNI